jgi:hypothetical protein
MMMMMIMVVVVVVMMMMIEAGALPFGLGCGIQYGRSILYIVLIVFSCLSYRSSQSCSSQQYPVPRVVGSRSALSVLLPVPDAVHSMLPLSPSSTSFTVTPVFFNIGINEMATLAESLGNTRPQDKSNLDNYERVNEYYYRFRKLHFPAEAPGQRGRIIICCSLCVCYHC